MSVIKGQNMRVEVDGKCVAMSVNTTFQIQSSLEDSSTKDSTGDWTEQEVVGKSWSASTDSLVSLTDNGSNGELPAALVALILAGTKVTLTFDVTGGTNNRVGQNSALKMQGDAFLQTLDFSAPNRQNTQLKATFQGTGALTTV